MNIVASFYHNDDCVGACEKIVNESIKMWKKNEKMVDDITVIVIFINKEFDGCCYY
jgi:hypothetical protein